MGTFGGPVSSINFPVFGFNLNQRGDAIGWSAFSTPTSSTSSPFVCGGLDGVVPFITHAFEWTGTVHDLGALPPQRENCSEPFAINNAGDVAGASENGEYDPLLIIKQARAVLWKNGQIIDLGTLGGLESAAFALNDRGQVAGNSTNNVRDVYCFANSDQNHGFFWQNGHMRDLGTLGGNCSVVNAINERGEVVGGSTTSAKANPITGAPPEHPFLWRENGEMQDLKGLGGDGSAGALNERDQVIGSSGSHADPGACDVPDHPTVNCHPFLWERGRIVDLNTSTIGGKPVFLSGINDDGEIIGSAAFPHASFDAFIWRQGVATDLGHLDGCTSSAHSMNSRRQIVGWVFPCNARGDVLGFLWEKGSMVDLNTLISRDSNLRIVQAEDINDRGEIAGIGVPRGVSTFDYQTRGHGFLLIPCDRDGRPITDASIVRDNVAGNWHSVRRFNREAVIPQ